MNGKVVFIVETAPEKGLGHLSRCLVLAEALAEQGAACRFVLTHPDGVALVNNFPVALLENDRPEGDIAIVDAYDFDTTVLDRLKGGVRRLVLIDDLADRPYPADIVINPNIYGEEIDYTAYGAGRVLVGPRYCLVRREFFALRRRAPPSTPRILVTLGGGETASLGVDLARVLHARCGVSVAIALGTAHIPDENGFPIDISMHARAHMPCLMKGASLVICGLGVTFLETLATGLPVIGVQVAHSQRLAFAAAQKLQLAVFPQLDAAAISEVAAETLRYASYPPPTELDADGPKRAAKAIVH